MAEHGTAAYTLGQFTEVQVAITRALPRALKDTDPKEMIRVLQNGEQLERMLTEGFRSLQRDVRGGKVVPSFSIRCEGNLKTSELVTRGKYDWVNDLITDGCFPLMMYTPVTRTIKLIEFTHDPSSLEVLAEFRRLGLERPTPEDALCFGIDYPDEQRKHSLVFLHEPGQGPGGGLCILVLTGGVGERYLELEWFDHRWSRGCLFAGVSK